MHTHIGTIIALVQYRGGGAVDICLNAVATLFLVELDNLSFMFGLNEDVRMQVFANYVWVLACVQSIRVSPNSE